MIDGWGNEVTIDCDRIVDLRSGGVVVACGDPPGEVSDPWCREVSVEHHREQVWVAVCHKELPVRPVRAQPTGCGCDDAGCEYSRWQDGYEIRLLDACPPSHKGEPPSPKDVVDSGVQPLTDCPPCPEDPCVVLASVHIDENENMTIDNCSCRRMVVSLAPYWLRCATQKASIEKVTVSTKGPYTAGRRAVRLVAKGTNLSGDAIVALGPGVDAKIVDVTADGTTMRIDADIARDAGPGGRTLTIMDPDCSTRSWPNALMVSPDK